MDSESSLGHRDSRAVPAALHLPPEFERSALASMALYAFISHGRRLNHSKCSKTSRTGRTLVIFFILTHYFASASRQNFEMRAVRFIRLFMQTKFVCFLLAQRSGWCLFNAFMTDSSCSLQIMTDAAFKYKRTELASISIMQLRR